MSTRTAREKARNRAVIDEMEPFSVDSSLKKAGWRARRQAAYEASMAKRTRDLRLTARVLKAAPRRLLAESAIAEMCDVDERTIRRWERDGLPQHGTARAVRYDSAEAVQWQSYHHVVPVKDRPALVDMLVVDQWNLEAQRKDNPRQFILVPLEHDHPLREKALQIAAAGSCEVYPDWNGDADEFDDE